MRGIRADAGLARAWLRGLNARGVAWQERGASPDALVLLPGPLRALRVPRAPVVVMPGDRNADAKQIITYGYSARETLTYSSLDASGPVLAVQREILTVGGARLDRQEIPLQSLGRTDAELALALSGALLFAGLAPEALGQVRFDAVTAGAFAQHP